MKRLMKWSLYIVGIFLAASLAVASANAVQAPAKQGSITLQVLNPMGVIEPPPTLGLSPRVTDLAGKKIALMHNNKQGASNLYDALQELLQKKYPTATLVRGYQTGPTNPPQDPEMYKKAAAECQAFVFAMGD